ncbi:MAG: molybdopterin-dependent oxidoreductase [Acidobacteria bacterium]|nr:molybdopterin-dependent oxidoreductase [Acidobacteriota bacterium]
MAGPKAGRLAVPVVRRRGDAGFSRVSWDEASVLVARDLRTIDPRRLGWFRTSRGLTKEAYYAHQKVARFLGTNHIDTSSRICNGHSATGLKATIGIAATTC